MTRIKGIANLPRFFIGFLTVFLVFCATACSTCPPCTPERVEVLVPVVSCPVPVELTPLVLPPFPVIHSDPTNAEIKEWYVDMVETIKAREGVCLDYTKALEGLLEVYREPVE